MDKHRNRKIAIREGFSNMRQMLADVIAASAVGSIVCFDLNCAAIGFQEEVMGCCRL